MLKCVSLSELEGGSGWAAAVNLVFSVFVLWGGMWAFFLNTFLDAVSLKIVIMTRGGNCGEKEDALFLSLPSLSSVFSPPTPIKI